MVVVAVTTGVAATTVPSTPPLDRSDSNQIKAPTSAAAAISASSGPPTLQRARSPRLRR